MKSQKGITLIALIITIIVMLILVAVTITMAVNGGLFDQAKTAGEATNAATNIDLQYAEGKVNFYNPETEEYELMDLSDIADLYKASK